VYAFAQTLIGNNGTIDPMTPVPFRTLGESHRDRILQHLLALSAHDRYLRFGFHAQNEHIRQYAAGLDFERDEFLGIYNRNLLLVATAHIACTHDQYGTARAEFGTSVVEVSRGKGYGTRLFQRACIYARNAGLQLMLIQALSENQAMLKIARNAGAIVHRDGQDCEAQLLLPHATLDSRFSEFFEQRVGLADHRMKVYAHRDACAAA